MIHYVKDRYDGGGSHAVDPIVLIGSLGSTAEMWDAQVPALREHAEVLRLEHRGHAGSAGLPAPESLDDLVGDLLEVLDAEGIERAHIAGVSLGGMIALAAAIAHPDRVGKVAVMCTSAAFEARQYWLDRAELVLAQGPAAVAADIVSRWFTPGFAAQHPALVRSMTDMIGATGPAGYAGCCRAIAEMDLRPALGSITTDVLAIGATGDRTTPPEQLQTIARLTPGARYVEVAGAHLVNVENPEPINGLLVRHLVGDGASA